MTAKACTHLPAHGRRTVASYPICNLQFAICNLHYPRATLAGPAEVHITTRRSREAASFDSRGCNPGYTCRGKNAALKGRYSPSAPDDIKADFAHRASRWEFRPVGAKRFIASDHPGLRCAAPWAIEYDPFGVTKGWQAWHGARAVAASPVSLPISARRGQAPIVAEHRRGGDK